MLKNQFRRIGVQFRLFSAKQILRWSRAQSWKSDTTVIQQRTQTMGRGNRNEFPALLDCTRNKLFVSSRASICISTAMFLSPTSAHRRS